MIFDLVRRYAFAVCLFVYVLGILVAHALGRLPCPGKHDISTLIGEPVTTLEGTVVDFPSIRWEQTRFLLAGHDVRQPAVHGRVLVTLSFPLATLGPGDRVRVRGWLRGLRAPAPNHTFDEQGYWAQQGVFSQLKGWTEEGFFVVKPSPPWNLLHAAWIFRGRFAAFWNDALPLDEAQLILGITLGARGTLPAELKDACIRAGVYHMVVVSGQKIAWLVALGIGLLKLCRVPQRWAFWICAPVLIFYSAVVGADPPVVRASIMACTALAVLAMRRDIPRYYALFLAAAAILLWDPAAILGASFQLSFAATASLIYLGSLLGSLRRSSFFFLRWCWEAGLMGLAVNLGVWPLLIYYFHQWSLAGLIANWTVFPYSGVVMALGLVVGCWGSLAPGSVPLALIRLTGAAIRVMLWVVYAISGWSRAAVPLKPWNPWAIAMYYALLFGILFLVRRRAMHANFPSSLSARRYRLQP